MTEAATVRFGRKRTFRHSGLLVASALALSCSYALAFQSKITPNPRNTNNLHKESSASATQLCVVTDPNQLMRMDLPESDSRFDRKALEDLYLISIGSDGLSGELVEEAPKKKRVVSLESTKMSKPSASSPSPDDVIPEASVRRKRPVQFRGLSTTPNPRSRSRRRKSLTTIAPTERSRALLAEPHSIPTQRRSSASPTPSRSSTMPGFMERSSTDKQKAFRDGIKLAEGRSGKKYVDTAAAKKKRRQVNGSMMYKTSASVPDSMVQFANEIHEVERITPKEEIILGEKTQEAIRLQKIYDGLAAQLAREPSDEEWCAAAGKINMEAISQTIEEGLEAKNKLVTSNLRMVQGVVNVYIRNGLQGQYNAGDLMQEGIMALIRAAEKFDPSRGFRFSTYAMYWIRSAIKRSQIFQSRVVTVPQRLYENHKRIKRVAKELEDSLDRAPTKKELGIAVGMSEVQIDRCLAAMAQRCYSLDQQIANPLKAFSTSSGGDTMYELVASKSDDGGYSGLKHVFLREDLIETLHRHLTEEEATLLLLRYGLADNIPQNLKTGPLTIAEVSRMVGLKPDKVRRMINKSLKRLKAVIGSEWADYDLEFQ